MERCPPGQFSRGPLGGPAKKKGGNKKKWIWDGGGEARHTEKRGKGIGPKKANFGTGIGTPTGLAIFKKTYPTRKKKKKHKQTKTQTKRKKRFQVGTEREGIPQGPTWGLFRNGEKKAGPRPGPSKTIQGFCVSRPNAWRGKKNRGLAFSFAPRKWRGGPFVWGGGEKKNGHAYPGQKLGRGGKGGSKTAGARAQKNQG